MNLKCIAGVSIDTFEQFPPGSEHLPMPKVLLYSLQMTNSFMERDYLPLTLESMRYNAAAVDFVVVAIVDDVTSTANFQTILDKMRISNVKLHTLSVADFKALLKKKLNIYHPMEKTSNQWARKLPDFKPVAAHLFDQFLVPSHKYWGYIDMDVIVGNISRYAHWFQGDHPFVKTHRYPHGPLSFFQNKPELIKMYVYNTEYLQLLQLEMNYNLDEIGKYTPDISHSHISVESLTQQYLESTKQEWNGGGSGTWDERADYHKTDSVMMDMGKAGPGRFGPVVWNRGTLQIVTSSVFYNAGREIMFFHRPEPRLPFPVHLQDSIMADMLQFGFLLPNWMPLLTRFLCKRKTVKNKNLYEYKPYSRGCFAKNTTDKVILWDQDPEYGVEYHKWYGR